MMDYVEQLRKADRPDLAELLRKAWKNAVVICAKEHSDSPEPVSAEKQTYFRLDSQYVPAGEIPVGASKTGGFPDLPPEIPYPEMSGFTRTFLQGDLRGKAETVPESAMQLMAQINLRELAASGADIENRLPETGMLYFFFSHYACDVFDIPESPNAFSKVDVETPEKGQIAKVIYWDGDMTALRRAAPARPYCYGVIPGLERERAIGFRAADDYDREMLSWGELDEICEILEIEDSELFLRADKLLGAPRTVNPPYTAKDEVNLLQMIADEGSVVSYFWAIDKQALAGQDLAAAGFWEDCD